MVADLSWYPSIFDGYLGTGEIPLTHAAMAGHGGSVYVDDQDRVWVSDDNGIFTFSRSGQYLSHFTVPPYPFEAEDLLLAPDGTVWVTSLFEQKLYNFAQDGTVLSSFPVDIFPLLRGVAMLPDGTLVVAGDGDSRLQRYDTSGNLLTTIQMTDHKVFYIDVVGEDQTWQNLGNGLTSINPPAETPLLIGSGTLEPGTPVKLKVHSQGANSPSALVIGYQEVNFPIFGGTLVPALNNVIVFPTASWIAYTTSWPAGFPGTEFWFQAWILDPAGPQGYTASYALHGREP